MAQALTLPREFVASAADASCCFHCGLPLPGGKIRTVPVLGRLRPMCCPGCEAIARTIVEAGCESFYETRTGPAAGPAPDVLPDLAIYDDPLARRRFVASTNGHECKTLLVLDGIRCAACVWLNERVLRRLPGVTDVSINYATRRVHVAWDERVTSLGRIVAAVRSLGYDAFPFEAGRQDARDAAERRDSLWRLFVAGFGAMQVMMYAFPRYIDDAGTLSGDAEQVLRWASLVLTLPVVAFACGPFFRAALADLSARRMGIDVPVSLGILGGFAASAWATLRGSGEVYFDSITTLVLLLLASRYLESSARRKASASLDRLARWMPSFAFRLTGAGMAEGDKVPAHDLRTGDRVLVAPGETIPADGLVRQGDSSADESLLTGESQPVRKSAGSPLIAGSVNIGQPLVMEVTEAGQETQAAAIGRLIERAAAGRPRLVETADRVARVLTWAVLAAAALAFAVWMAVDPERAPWAAIAVLMVSCPCALGLAAPIALTSATGALARRGIVVTRAQAIESLDAATDAVLDKTGTLTEGTLGLLGIDCLGGTHARDCLAIAKAMEAGSAHPVARAIAALPHADATPGLRDVVHFAGQGIEARLGAGQVRIGTRAFVAALAGGPPDDRPAPTSGTPVYLGTESGWLARFTFGDPLRADAQSMVDALRDRGLVLHLASGDDARVVADVAATLGIQRHTGGCSPEGKYGYVRRLQAAGRGVLMIGDGLNDAPVLAQADVSIAMSQGAALAQQQAGFVLLSGRLDGVAEAARIAGLAMRTIRQNFAWALAYNAVAIPLAAFGLVGPREAAIGMAASSLAVVLNCARLTAALR